MIRQLALYMTRLGIPAYVLPKNTTPKVPRYTPHIFSNNEIAALFKQADACHYCAEVPLRHRIMPVLFRLLYGCGLRISERGIPLAPQASIWFIFSHRNDFFIGHRSSHYRLLK